MIRMLKSLKGVPKVCFEMYVKIKWIKWINKDRQKDKQTIKRVP